MKCIDTLSWVISNLCKFKPHPAVEKVCTVRACACVCVCVCVCVWCLEIVSTMSAQWFYYWWYIVYFNVREVFSVCIGSTIAWSDEGDCHKQADK